MDHAARIESATLSVRFLSSTFVYPSALTICFFLPILQTIAEGTHITRDLGGKASTSEFTAQILAKLA